jgi:hypothetical protein
MDFGITETGFARGSPPGTTTEVPREGFPISEIRFVSMSAFLMPSKIFSSSFRSIGSLLPIGRHLTSLRFDKTSNRSAAKLTCSFFFWTDVHAIRPVDSSTTSS